MVACASAGQVTGRPLPEPGTSALGGGRPQNRVGVEPMDQGPEDCLGWLARLSLWGRLRKWTMHLGGKLSWGLLPARSETSGGMSYAGSGNRQGPPRTGDNTLGGGLTQIGVGVEPIGQGPQNCPGLVGKATALGVAPPKVADAPRAHVVVGSASWIPKN